MPILARWCKRGARAQEGGWPASLLIGAFGLGTLLATAPARPAAAQACEKPPTSKLVVDVRQKGAKGDGRSDDTAAIQAAVDAVGGTGGTVAVPDGLYMVDAVSERRLRLRDNMTVRMSRGAILKAIPNGSQNYSILSITGVSNVTVSGGTLEGDRDQHKDKVGEWGMGIMILGGSKNVTISGVTAKDMWGDGFYVQGAKSVTFCSVVSDRNRRQGLSVIEVDGLDVLGSSFKNTHGTRPSAGIDLEPDSVDQRVRNVRIRNSKFVNNAGPGILVAGKKHASLIAGVEITENVFIGAVPIKIEYSPEVLQSAICRNRQITPQVEPTGNLSSYAESRDLVVVQSGCGDRWLQVRR